MEQVQEKGESVMIGELFGGGVSQFVLDIIALFSIYSIVVLSLNLEAGYTGIPNFGKLLGVAVGAFTVSALSGRLAILFHNLENPSSPITYKDYVQESAKLVFEVNKWLAENPLMAILLLFLTLAIAALAGGAIGYLASYPAIRLRGDYLAITLLAMAEAVRVIGYNYPPIAGGTLGMQVPNPFAAVGENRYAAVTAFLALMVLVTYVLYSKMLCSPLGRVLRATRDNELSAESLGKDVVSYRKKVIVIGTATAAVAGALYAYYTGGVIATAYHRVAWTFWPWVMLMLGGMANNLGALVGTFIFVVMRYSIIRYKTVFEGILPFNVVWLDYMLLGIALLVVLMLRPQGVLPEKPVRTVKKTFYDADRRYKIETS